MTEKEPQNIITLSVVSGLNLRGAKDNFLCTLSIEWNDRTLAASGKYECTFGTVAEFNFSTTVSFQVDDAFFVDDLINKPFSVTITEVFPKEKKQKEEKSALLGQSTFSVYSLFVGEPQDKLTLPVIPFPGSSLDSKDPEKPKPTIDVLLSADRQIFSESKLGEVNFAKIVLQSMYSPPDSWQLSGQQFVYHSAMQLPITSEKTNNIVFTNGVLKPSAEKEAPSRQKFWNYPLKSGAPGSNVIPNDMITTCAVEDEDGDLRSKDERHFRHVAEMEKNRVVWNGERKCYLDAAGVRQLQERISRSPLWALEVMRTPQPVQAGKGAQPKSTKDDELPILFHGTAYLNLSPLLYPGVRRVRGAFMVEPFYESVLSAKTEQRQSAAPEAVKYFSSLWNRNAASPVVKKGKDKEGGDGKKEKKEGKGNKSALSAGGGDEKEEPVNTEGQMYRDSRTFVIVDIQFHRALIRRRTPEELADKVAAYIPPRPLFPKRTDGAQRAVEDYRSQVNSISELLLLEYRRLFKEEPDGANTSLNEAEANEQVEKRRRSILYELNTSGKYFAFKEQLKHSVVKIVREKFLRTRPFETDDELELFLSELYVYLVDEMHVALADFLSVSKQIPIPEPPTDVVQLKLFAIEATMSMNYELAERYYQERVARTKNNDPSCWIDYGAFSLHVHKYEKAEQCFRECLAVDQSNGTGLVLFAISCALQEKFGVAEEFLDAATAYDPQNIVLWTIFGLFYESWENDIGTEMAFGKANKLNVSQAKKALGPPQPPASAMDKSESHDSALGTAPVVAATAAPNTNQLGEPIPTTPEQHTSSQQDVESQGRASKVQSKQGGSQQGKKRSKGARKDGVSPPPESAAANINDPMVAPAIRESIETPEPSQTIFMQAAQWLFEHQAFSYCEHALSHHLLVKQGGPSFEYYLLLARLKILAGEYPIAEEALRSALQLDFLSADVMALTGHCHYLMGDTANAKFQYERLLALENEPEDLHTVFLRLGSIYLIHQLKACLLTGVKTPTNSRFVAWCRHQLLQGLFISRKEYGKLGELSEAEDALCEANLLNNLDPVAWAYLSLLCLKTNRQLEAEQAYKYAVKLDLQDDELMKELHELQHQVGFGNPEA